MKTIWKQAAALLVAAALCFCTACEGNPIWDFSSDAQVFPEIHLPEPPSSTAELPSQKPVTSMPSGRGVVVPETPLPSKYYSYYSQRSDYACLSADGKRLYDEVLESLYSISREKDEDGLYQTHMVNLTGVLLDDQEIRSVILAVQNDNPEIFWLAPWYYWPPSLRGTKLQFYSYLSAGEINELIPKFTRRISEVVAEIPPDLSDLDREEWIYRKIADTCEYDEESLALGDEAWEPYTAYGTLCLGKAVCEGYARAMQLLCSYADIPCRLVGGWSEGEGHMWNLVKIGEDWYHADPTWDDMNPVAYSYLNLTDEQISRDHTISPSVGTEDDEFDFNLCLPACDSVEANYFRARGIPITGTEQQDVQAVAERLAEFARQRTESVPLFIAAEQGFFKTERELFLREPYFFYDCVEAANGLLDDCQIDYNDVEYVNAPDAQGITVLLDYDH